MPLSEAQKRATANYKKHYVKNVSLTFSPPDHQLWDWLEEQPSKAGYIKQLIREDMNKKKGL